MPEYPIVHQHGGAFWNATTGESIYLASTDDPEQAREEFFRACDDDDAIVGEVHEIPPCPDCENASPLATHDDADYPRCRECWESAWEFGRKHVAEAWEDEQGQPIPAPTLRAPTFNELQDARF